MIIYNVTIKIESTVHDEWKQWMESVHIPDVMATGHFNAYRLCKLIGLDESDGVTYAVQYELNDLDALQSYQDQHAQKLQAEHSQRYKDRFVAFRTLMNIVSRSE